ncbi:MAG: hypothetical protein WD766_08010 [Gemmatimonadota bacterium]
MGRSLLLLTLLIAVAACSSRSAGSEGFIRPPRSVDEVEMIVGTPRRPYLVVGVWQAEADSGYGTAADLFRERMLEEAAEMGADGVIFTVTEVSGSGRGGRDPDGLTTTTTITAEIIYWISREAEEVRDIAAAAVASAPIRG